MLSSLSDWRITFLRRLAVAARRRAILILLLLIAPVAARALSIERMTTNGRTNPLGIAGDDVSLAWASAAQERGAVQSAYRIRVGLAEGADNVWDSGRVASDRQIDIPVPPQVPLLPATRYFWQVEVWDGRGVASGWSAPAWFETGLVSERDWSGAKWIAHASAPNAPAQSLPLFRRALNVKKTVKSARLYASAHGLYRLSVNGQKVGDQYLSPGWTDYTKRIQAQTFDVTPLLRKGVNVIGAALADGWYRGKVGLNWHGVYGDTLALIAKLQVTYADGSTESFVSDGEWRSTEGPFVQGDLQDGEIYDARLERTNWDCADFDASAWAPAAALSEDLGKLVPQPDEPVRETQLLTALARTTPVPGEYVYDLGQNMVGVARVSLTGKKGQTVRLRYAEELYRKGERSGRLYTDNFRTAKVTDTYTFGRDGTVIYQPTFTQHGFRYVEITGVDAPPEVNEVRGVVIGSDLPDIGDLHLSHPMLDRLVRNIRWGQRGNFVSIPTDTPARDERLGWTGDISVFSPTASRFQDTRAFLGKWMDDLRDSQRVNGNIPAVVPQPRREFDETGVGWSDAFITVPYAVWRSTGDLRIVRRNWEAMRRFYGFVRDSATHDGNLLEEGRNSWFSGDWLNLENADRLEEHRVIATAYFAENTRMMAEMAAAMGEAEQAAEWSALAARIRAAFVAAYRLPDGSIYTGTQTVHAMTLGMDLIADPALREATAVRFVEKISRDNFHLRTGFLGTPWLLPALTSIGRDDLAMRLLLNEDYPSWGFEIGMGATTMWERWNSIRADGEFGPVDMNSFNHYAYGAVGDWMFAHLGGLQIVEPGYRKSRIAPLIGQGGLSHGQCSIRTPYGLLASEWQVTGARQTLAATVPVNTSAEIVIRAKSPESVREGKVPATSAPGVKGFEFKNGQLTLKVGSGRYEFTIYSELTTKAAK
ncbi:MAG TPA: family 78 glycoside hydrolase catalytic domain [Lacunisphaera sp.]